MEESFQAWLNRWKWPCCTLRLPGVIACSVGKYLGTLARRLFDSTDSLTMAKTGEAVTFSRRWYLGPNDSARWARHSEPS